MVRYVAGARIRSFRELRECWREDIAVNQGFWRPGAQALIMYRLGVWQAGLQRGLVRSVASRIYGFLHVVVRNYYGIELPASAHIGRRLYIVHQSAIVIHPQVVMGDDCLIRQGVTLGVIGSSRVARQGARRGPVTGDRVEIGAGAVIMGPITIGDDVKIGPNAVVMRNVPSGAVVAAPPARVMSRPPKTETPRIPAVPNEGVSGEEMAGAGND
jgi:serine O-acetyltransferase